MQVAAGTIVFDADIEPFAGATVYVRLEEVTRADAPSRVIAETILRDVQVGGQGARELEFTIDMPMLDPRERYVLRVHVDVDGDGRIGVGDYVSTGSYPVVPGAGASARSIQVKRVS